MPKSRKFQDNLPKRGKREENMERIQKISRQLAANIKSAFQKKEDQHNPQPSKRKYKRGRRRDRIFEATFICHIEKI